jgi:hypothetical protein
LEFGDQTKAPTGAEKDIVGVVEHHLSWEHEKMINEETEAERAEQ